MVAYNKLSNDQTKTNNPTMEDKRTWDCVKKPFQAIVL